MGMILSTNILALNSRNFINKNRNKTHKSMEKLASAYKINHSSDDASGLAISEKMRNKITALDTDINNCEDGVNCLQVADGAMDEINDILQRCMVLAGRAANGTLEDEEREIIQNEIDQLHSEIYRIKDSVKFNERKILQNNSDGDNFIKGDLPQWAVLDNDSQDSGCLSDSYNGFTAAKIDISSFTSADVDDSIGKGFYSTCCTCDNFYSIEFTKESENEVVSSGSNFVFKVGLDGAQNAQDVYNRIADATNGGNPGSHYTNIGFENGSLIVYDNRPGQSPNYDAGMGLIGGGTVYKSKCNNMNLKIGDTSTSADNLLMSTLSISIEALGIKYVDVTQQDGASDAIDIYRNAEQVIYDARGKIGAYQNRLEHAINNMTNASEDLTDARSRIMDTDMAEEYSEYTLSSIVDQAAQAIFAQANAQPENVVLLLQQNNKQ